MDSNTDDRDPEVPPDVPADELQEALQWLEELTGPTNVGPTTDETADSPFHGLVDDGVGDLPDWLREAPQEPVSPRLADEGEFESRLDWLAKMAERESIEELPTLEWRNLSDTPPRPPADDAPPPTDDTLPPTFPPELLPVEATPPEPLTAEAVLVVPQPLPDEPASPDEMPASATALPDAEPPVAAPAAPITPEALIDTLPPDEELPPIDDLDAAMAWIEELAASQDAPIEDVPSVADRALASKLMLEAGLSPDGLDLQRAGDELALGDLSLLEGNTPVNAFVAAEDFADTIVLVETMAADQGRPVPAEYQVGEMPDATEVSFEEAMAFLDELAADQEPLGAQTQPLEAFDTPAVETVLFVTDELLPADDDAPVEPWPAEPEGAAEPEAAWAAEEVAEVAELDAAEPEEVLTAETIDALEADAALWPSDAPWLEPAAAESAVEWREPEIDRAATVEEIVPVLALAPAAEAMIANGSGVATLEETLRALDALALPPGRSLAEFDASRQQSGAAPVRRDLPAAVEWLELALGLSVPTTPPTPQWSDDELISRMPDDPDAVLAWLEQLAEEDTVDSSPQLSPAGETLPNAGQPLAAGAQGDRAAGAAESLIDELSDADLQAMPDDPDAVMAWLEGLAAGRGEAAPVSPTAPLLPEAPLPPTSPVADQSLPVASSRSRRRRGRRSQPVVATEDDAAAIEPPMAQVADAPAGEAMADETATGVIAATLTPDAPGWQETADVAAPDVTIEIAEVESVEPVEPALTEVINGEPLGETEVGAPAMTWVEEALAAPDVTIEIAEPVESVEPGEPALTEVVDGQPLVETEVGAPAMTWVEEALAALPEAADESPVEPAAPLPLPAQPRRRGRKPKVAPVDVATPAEVAGAVDTPAEQASDMAEAEPQPPLKEETPPPARPASWVDLLKPLK